jgi:hypothetical protein
MKIYVCEDKVLKFEKEIINPNRIMSISNRGEGDMKTRQQ